MAEAPKDSMPAVKTLLARWDSTTNPILLLAAGQLRQALRADGRTETARAEARSRA